MAAQERGKHTPGMFVWRELYTSDVNAAKRFYSEALGWKIDAVEMPGMIYNLFYAGDKQIGGMFSMAGIPTMWNPYVSVSDVDASAKAATENGGAILNGPHDIPNIGRMATVRDPQGAVFSLYKDAKGDPVWGKPGAGEFCWEQLNTTDTKSAASFYKKVVGWNAVPFSGGGSDVFTTEAATNNQAATLIQAPPGSTPSWMSHVAVASLTDTKERITRNGGKVLVPSIDVPNMGSFAVVSDPQGAIFSVFEAKM